MGFDARELTPGLVRKITFAAAESSSYERAARMVRYVGDRLVSTNTVRRVAQDVGRELQERRDDSTKTTQPLAKIPEVAPPLAVVQCDGGRIRTREPGHGPGVHLAGNGWRETKNAVLTRATHETFQTDPQPEPSECFLDPEQVAKIVELQIQAQSDESAEVPLEPSDVPAAAPVEGAVDEEDWRPKKLVRTVLSSMACSDDFGPQMATEAKLRKFDQATARAFLADGLAWNWSIHKTHFPSYTPILDFIHALSYLYVAANLIQEFPNAQWEQYEKWLYACWLGRIADVIADLHEWQEKASLPPDTSVPDAEIPMSLADVLSPVPETNPTMAQKTESRKKTPQEMIAGIIRYLEHNESRMDYAKYRCQGLPLTTAWMESTVKEIGHRVKGTEMYWNDPEGAEAILQIRAAFLSEDDRLINHLKTRQGCPFVRRPKPNLATASC